jgi:hypothetical protein
MAKIRVVHLRPDGKLDFDYDDIINLINDPMYIVIEDGSEQEDFLRKYGRSFVHVFVSRLQKAIDIMEKAQSVEHVDLDIYIPGEEWIVFRNDFSDSAHGLDTKHLRELLTNLASYDEKDEKKDRQILREQYRARWDKPKPKLPMYQMVSEGGCEDLDAQTEEEALAEMDERWPEWRESATMGLYYDPDVNDPNSEILTYNSYTGEWVPV